MKGLMSVRLGVMIAALFAAGVAGAQGPGAPVPVDPGAGPGFAEHRPPMERAMGLRGERGRWWNNPTIVEKLKLTDDQRKAMDGILQQHREKLIDLRANVDKAELGMEPMMGQDQPNEAAVMSQIDKIAQARAELEKANARFLFALRAKLTPEQWKQVQEFRATHEGMRRNWDRQGPRHGDRPRRVTPPPPPAAPAAPGPQGMLEDGPDMDAPVHMDAPAPIQQ